MGYEFGHGIYEGYPADPYYNDLPAPQCNEPCGYQPVCVPVPPPQPIITETHHMVEHDWECCYVYHRVLWLICMVLVLYSLAATFMNLLTDSWLESHAGNKTEYTYDYVYSSYVVTNIPGKRLRRSANNNNPATGGSDSDSDYEGSEAVSCGWLKQCQVSTGMCYPNALEADQKDSKLPLSIGQEQFSAMRFLVPFVMAIHLILLLIFILHLLFPYPTIDALVFAVFNAGAMAYTTLVAMDVCNPTGADCDYKFGFWLWIGATGSAALILFFIVVMCCTGCHF